MRRHPPSLLGGGGSEPSPWCSLILKPPLDTVSHRPFNNNCGHFGTQDEPLGSCDRWWTGEKRFPAGTALRCHALRWLEIGSLTSLLIPPISATRLLSVTAAWLRTTNGDVNVGVWKVVQMSCYSSQTSRAHTGSYYSWHKWRRNCYRMTMSPRSARWVVWKRLSGEMTDM